MDIANKLLRQTNYAKNLKNFGLISEAIYTLDQSVKIKTRKNESQLAQEIQRELNKISDRKNSFLAYAVVGSVKACWFDFLHDRVCTDHGQETFFDLIHSNDTVLVEK
eukprot:11710516-Ditylum_brightwellii.AAC.1